MSCIRNNNIIDLALWALGQRQRLKVEGWSMSPCLNPGDELLVSRQTSNHPTPFISDIIIMSHPCCPDLRLIKRVISVNKDGSCFVRGDNALCSTDSRSFGWIEPKLIFGHVTSRFF
ncbi:nickel-type superoxide dismutase maturation protease [Candidatus Atelocyanobacterium thalassae]|uniref:Peptidase S26 domain-containing protein n=1 Tax=cyanobacterium endosymbiont of Braarudosphaera bigelowii TaxID=1285375 RepID=A0ABM7U3R3_9CHRO|nr:nickel-type superoxide dismutase maturation protease [Candidatus Atelocyanobacterium thalassa]BDA39215.1 hypothetical protein CPARK_000005400 [cyanobacterium endosymbiont of Braarudosphaera bigelowii]